ncbi:MAG: GNAT family N-acetyltransferase [Phycisphaeraceae bacterium]|nr:GNAT family N-acetyltransferase [Phycisphaeraceae bacterium]
MYLRRPLATDRAAWIALRESSLDHLLKWEPRLRVRSEAERWDTFFRTSDSDERQRLLIFRNEDSRMVGYVGLNGIRHGALQGCDLGYWMGKEFTRRGYMTEALLLAIRHAFGSLELHRVEANVQPHNVASIGVLKKAGMRFEGVAIRFLQIDGKWCDHQRWAMTIEEWKDPLAPIKHQPARQKRQT